MKEPPPKQPFINQFGSALRQVSANGQGYTVDSLTNFSKLAVIGFVIDSKYTACSGCLHLAATGSTTVVLHWQSVYMALYTFI